MMSYPVYVVADNNMPSDKVDVHVVNGLGNTVGGSDNKAYLVFCHTKCCNEAFFKWFDDEILLPYVRNTKRDYALPDSAQTLFFHDGEAVQLKGMFNPEMIEKFRVENVHALKIAASTSQFGNPLDQDPFLAAKGINKSFKRNSLPEQSWLEDQISVTISAHFTRFPASGGNVWSAQKKKAHIIGLIRVQAVVRRALTEDTIRKSFATLGIYPYSHDIIMKNFQKFVKFEELLTSDELNRHRELVPKLSSHFRRNGEIFDDVFREYGIGKDEDIKDQLVLWRRRCVLLTALDVIQREDERTKRKAEEAVEKEQRKKSRAQAQATAQAAKAQRAIDAETRKAQKAEARLKKADEAAAKKAEKARASAALKEQKAKDAAARKLARAQALGKTITN
jgi:hypothetical protein